jgi:uncharacterized protein involved in type VI secretion and phage assembly
MSRHVALYEGVVVDNADPKKIGRVKVRVPGLIEPASDWALPAMVPGGGEKRRGFFFVPPKGAEVSVWFVQGDPERPRYCPSHWGAPGGQSQAPTPVQDATVEEAPLIGCIETDNFLLVFDDRPGKRSVEIGVKESGDRLIFDAESHMVELKGTVGVRIKSTGAISLEALRVTINGRPVLPGKKPI